MQSGRIYEKLHVFDKDGLYLATKKIGKNNPKAEQIRADNEKRMQWNREVDRAIVSNVPVVEIGQIKKKYITDRIKASVDTFGSQPQLYGSIIATAVAVLALLVSKVLRKAAELSEKISDTWQEQALPPKPIPLPKAQKQPELQSGMVFKRCRTPIELIIQPRTLMQTIRRKQPSGKKHMEQR